MRELCGRSRFARTVDTNQKNHFGPIRQRTKLRVGDGKRLLDVGTRDLDNISGRDPALTALQFFNDPKRHRHAEVRLDQSFFQFIPIDISAAESLDQVLEKSDCHRFRILEKPNGLQNPVLVEPDLRAGCIQGWQLGSRRAARRSAPTVSLQSYMLACPVASSPQRTV